jgi:hypothetical protein
VTKIKRNEVKLKIILLEIISLSWVLLKCHLPPNRHWPRKKYGPRTHVAYLLEKSPLKKCVINYTSKWLFLGTCDRQRTRIYPREWTYPRPTIWFPLLSLEKKVFRKPSCQPGRRDGRRRLGCNFGYLIRSQ